MFHLPRVIFFTVFLFLISLFLLDFPIPIYAVEYQPLPSLIPNSSSYQDPSLPRFITGKNLASEGNIVKSAVTVDTINDVLYGVGDGVACFGCDSKRFFSSSGLGLVANAMNSVYNEPPASFGYFAQDFLASSGLVKPAYAQGVGLGIGFNSLRAILPLWKISRNIAYMVLTLVMVAIGFMIIFRMKIDPKTVISVQAAIPKIIVTLLLITFSYAIAGLMIDLMYVCMALIISLMAQAIKGYQLEKFLDIDTLSYLSDSVKQTQAFLRADMGTLFQMVLSGGMNHTVITKVFFGSVASGLGTAGLTVIPFAIASAFTPLTAFLVGPIPLFLLLILLGLLFTFIRLLFLLFNSYIQLIITVVLGPILLLQEAIPGKSAFNQWLMNLIANLSVFPAVVFIIYASWIFTAVSLPAAGGLWTPPFLGIPFIGGGQNANPFSFFVGLGIIFLAPNLVVTIKKLFNPKPVLPISAGTAFSPLTGALQTGMGAASQFYYTQQMFQSGALKNAFGGIGGLFKKH